MKLIISDSNHVVYLQTQNIAEFAGRMARFLPQQPPKQVAPAPRQPAPQAKPAAPQPPRRGNNRSASAIPSAPLRDQPKAPRPQRSRAQHSAVPNEPGLDLISRRPPKQKFANFEDSLAAQGGMPVPLPLAAADAPEAEKPAPAAEATE
mgnify:CR=1 FL=1